jgi:hypothetical protein
MRPSGPIAEFAAAIACELSFDAALARRVRSEVEDHLLEAVAHEPEGASEQVQRRLIAAFGSPREIAQHYATASLFSQVRRITALMGIAVIVVFGVMKARVAWYAAVQWTSQGEHQATSAIGLSIDRLAFALAFAVALSAAVYVATRRAPPRWHLQYNREMGRCIVLCAAVLCALLVAVATELVLTGIRLSGSELSVAGLVPIFSLMLECAAVGSLIAGVRSIMLRRMAAVRLFES